MERKLKWFARMEFCLKIVVLLLVMQPRMSNSGKKFSLNFNFYLGLSYY